MEKINKGDYIYHKREGIMFVQDIVKEDVLGQEREYLVLKLPYNFDIEMMFPYDQKECFREIRDTKTLDKIIKSFKEYDNMWIVDNKLRKETFLSIIDEGDTFKIHSIAMTIFNKRKELSSMKKPLPLQDVKILELCNKLIYQEIAFAYKIELQDVEAFINNKLGL